MPSTGMINAGAANAVYLGLIETESAAANASLSLPSAQLLPLESFRRMLDGVIAALSGDTATPPRRQAFHHRGATVWISEAVMWQAGWPANKRLARITIRSSAAGDVTRLTRLAARNRRTARVEDAYILEWLSRPPSVP